MGRPKAYDPQSGYKYQILCAGPGQRELEHCDYAVDRADKKHLIENYQQAYGAGWRFSTIVLPRKFWPKAHKERKLGEQTACKKCGQDIEYHGEDHGWLDRGSGTSCLPYLDRKLGEYVTPEGEHEPS